jgi:hypothetical protein
LEFEAALSLFRASTTSPASPDLPARILRKLQSTNRRRPAFGTVFGINLKWASAFSAALVAVIIGSAIVLERDAARKLAAGPTPIPVVLQKQAAAHQAPPPPADQAVRRDSPPAKMKESIRQESKPVPPAPGIADASGDSRFASSPPPEPAAAAESKVRPQARGFTADRAEESERSARVVAEAPIARIITKSESAGGEGAATSSLASAETGAAARLVVVALDGQGSAPWIVSANAGELLTDLRGRQYVLIVDASGRVGEARANAAGRPSRLEKRARAKDALENAAAVPAAVLGLRFHPSDRARRLLLRVE